jgi:hypothetical protein
MISTNLISPLKNFIVDRQALVETQSSLSDVRLDNGDMERHVSSLKIAGKNKDQSQHNFGPFIRYNKVDRHSTPFVASGGKLWGH